VVDAIELDFHSHFFKQNLNGFVQFTAADTFVADDPMLVEQIDCRPAIDLPFVRDGAVRSIFSVGEAPPTDVLRLVFFQYLLAYAIAIDPDNRERFASQNSCERPLMWEHCPTRSQKSSSTTFP